MNGIRIIADVIAHEKYRKMENVQAEMSCLGQLPSDKYHQMQRKKEQLDAYQAEIQEGAI